MPWVRAELRGQRVFARADDRGALLAERGRVEIRYRAEDGKPYRAAARNLTVVDATPLPDDTCAAAGDVDKKARQGATGGSAPATGPESGEAVIVYTDGACSGNPGPAGLGVVVQRAEETIERYEFLGTATNNIAELTAVLRALDEVSRDEAALIHTDSQYAIGVAQKGWKAKANTELVAELRRALGAHGRSQLRYVRGHAGIVLNERADALARRAIEERGSGRVVVRRGS
jgi:ribonuclease HI